MTAIASLDPGDIEPREGRYGMEDVMCADGQYDIGFDEILEVTNRRDE